MDRMDTDQNKIDLTSFEAFFSDPSVARRMRALSPTAFDAAAEFWRVPLANGHLTARMKELVLFAMHASTPSFNVSAMKGHIERSLSAGATKEDIVDVFTTIIGLANHALYASVPVREEEWTAAGKTDAVVADLDPSFLAAKERFIKARGFWNNDRDSLGRQIPDYFRALTDLAGYADAQGTGVHLHCHRLHGHVHLHAGPAHPHQERDRRGDDPGGNPGDLPACRSDGPGRHHTGSRGHVRFRGADIPRGGELVSFSTSL
ncbi:MAG: carboxymuconolactone decarboxylase family protein [Mesorhizobium sp.]|nr:MAG: carboxymuconolactone decarboxylase family protein [Mesorhizobium sp.]